MANSFIESAKVDLGGSNVMRGREKVSTDYIIENFPQGVTITEFDLIANRDGEFYPVFAFKENLKAYFNGGTLAARVANGWAKRFDGDIEVANAALKSEGGAKFRLYPKKTRTGKTITMFEPVE